MNTEKKLLSVKLSYQESLTACLDYGPPRTVEDITQIFTDILDRVKKIFEKDNYDRILMTFESEYGYYDSQDFVIKFIGQRYETDEEVQKRIETSKKEAQTKRLRTIEERKKKEEKDRKLFEQLKKKFGL